jgi:hypothetical protein
MREGFKIVSSEKIGSDVKLVLLVKSRNAGLAKIEDLNFLFLFEALNNSSCFLKKL